MKHNDTNEADYWRLRATEWEAAAISWRDAADDYEAAADDFARTLRLIKGGAIDVANMHDYIDRVLDKHRGFNK